MAISNTVIAMIVGGVFLVLIGGAALYFFVLGDDKPDEQEDPPQNDDDNEDPEPEDPEDPDQPPDEGEDIDEPDQPPSDEDGEDEDQDISTCTNILNDPLLSINNSFAIIEYETDEALAVDADLTDLPDGVMPLNGTTLITVPSYQIDDKTGTWNFTRPNNNNDYHKYFIRLSQYFYSSLWNQGEGKPATIQTRTVPFIMNTDCDNAESFNAYGFVLQYKGKCSNTGRPVYNIKRGNLYLTRNSSTDVTFKSAHSEFTNQLWYFEKRDISPIPNFNIPCSKTLIDFKKDGNDHYMYAEGNYGRVVFTNESLSGIKNDGYKWRFRPVNQSIKIAGGSIIPFYIISESAYDKKSNEELVLEGHGNQVEIGEGVAIFRQLKNQEYNNPQRMFGIIFNNRAKTAKIYNIENKKAYLGIAPSSGKNKVVWVTEANARECTFSKVS